MCYVCVSCTAAGLSVNLFVCQAAFIKRHDAQSFFSRYWPHRITGGCAGLPVGRFVKNGIRAPPLVSFAYFMIDASPVNCSGPLPALIFSGVWTPSALYRAITPLAPTTTRARKTPAGRAAKAAELSARPFAPGATHGGSLSCSATSASWTRSITGRNQSRRRPKKLQSR